MASKGRGERGRPQRPRPRRTPRRTRRGRCRRRWIRISRRRLRHGQRRGFRRLFQPPQTVARVRPRGLARPDARGRKRAWVRKQWKALTGIGDETDAVAIDGESEADVGAQPSPPQFAEADGGVLKDDVMEERSPEPSLVGEDTTAASDGSDKDGVSESNGAGGAMHGASGATGGKKKTDKRYLAVTPPKPYTVMRINAPDASENPGTHFNQQLTRRALLRDAELTPRDLRRIDPSLLQTNNTPALLVKDQTIMVNLGVRVIIRPDHALLFEPDTATAQRPPRWTPGTGWCPPRARTMRTSRRRKTEDLARTRRCTARIKTKI